MGRAGSHVRATPGSHSQRGRGRVAVSCNEEHLAEHLGRHGEPQHRAPRTRHAHAKSDRRSPRRWSAHSACPGQIADATENPRACGNGRPRSLALGHPCRPIREAGALAVRDGPAGRVAAEHLEDHVQVSSRCTSLGPPISGSELQTWLWRSASNSAATSTDEKPWAVGQGVSDVLAFAIGWAVVDGSRRSSARATRAARTLVLNAAYAATPERFVLQPPRPPALPTAAWINKRASEETEH